ncbi:MAG: DNA-binding protein [Deltaproteobacteria bacterium]|jgi:antitoxin FitA|nr:DNA-binding protein [Deltaproteobacteria bacterium]MBT4089496.1 DNA-binding protein [Deltaproteobacteria bacterium]MBT4268410.1 DNA-binding protein [Deltaproteobacteria bacterium]MBT4637675.1 DNA-binding protein [Deltaproteobacteria bacterium]MBT6503939.1 DNA-binding protein [Deltaproteobacteria bacterium]
MANLVVRNIDDDIVKALKFQAGKHGISAEAEHRRILKETLLAPPKKTFEEILAIMPNVGRDSDFSRKQNGKDLDVFT